MLHDYMIHFINEVRNNDLLALLLAHDFQRVLQSLCFRNIKNKVSICSIGDVSGYCGMYRKN